MKASRRNVFGMIAGTVLGMFGLKTRDNEDAMYYCRVDVDWINCLRELNTRYPGRCKAVALVSEEFIIQMCSWDKPALRRERKWNIATTRLPGAMNKSGVVFTYHEKTPLGWVLTDVA